MIASPRSGQQHFGAGHFAGGGAKHHLVHAGCEVTNTEGDPVLPRSEPHRVLKDKLPALEHEVANLAERLSNGATQAFACAKKLINQSFVTPIDKQLDDEIAYFAECAKTNDFKEGVTAFVEKRKPQFEGK